MSHLNKPIYTLPGNAEKLELLQKKNLEALKGGGDARIAAQHKKGKLTARERVDLLMDEGTFEEIDKFVMHPVIRRPMQRAVL